MMENFHRHFNKKNKRNGHKKKSKIEYDDFDLDDSPEDYFMDESYFNSNEIEDDFFD